MNFQKLPDTGGEELMWHSQVRVLVSRRMDLGTAKWDLDLCSPFWRIYVNDRVGAFIEHEGNRFPLRPNAVWVIPAWVRFQTGLTGPANQDYVHFHFTGLPSALRQRVFNHPICLQEPESLQILLGKWREGLANSASFSHLCWAGAVTQAALALVLADWNQREPGSYQRWLTESTDIQPALERIEERLAHPPSNRELGKLCGTSEDHFIRKFRKILGVTPAEYGRERRIAMAAEWLTSTPRTLEDIAESSGFTDRFHLSRVFKKRLGLPPATYRRMHSREG